MGLRQAGSEGADLKTSEEAAVWLQRLLAEDTPAGRAEFSAWIRRGPVDLEEFLFAQAIWKEMDHIDPGMRERLWSAKTADTVVDFPTSEPPEVKVLRLKKNTLSRPWRVSVAAILAVVSVCWGALAWFNIASNVYVTGLGEQRSVKLADGSIMYLNTNSRAEVKLTENERVIRLAAGEALFTVKHDAQRPFYVLTDRVRIRAIGTQFNVYRSSGTGTRIAVVDGVVQVSSVHAAPLVHSETSQGVAAEGYPAPINLKAGDEAEVDHGRMMKKAKRTSIESAVSWLTRRLIFEGNPIREIAEEFNRYNRTQIRAEGEEIRTRQMSGVFDVDDPSPLLEFLARDPSVEVVYGADEILIRSRRSDEAATASP